MTWWQAALAYVIGPLLATIGTVLVARTAAKGSIEAAEIVSEVEEETTAITGYHQLVADMRADIERLRTDHNALRDEHTELKRHVAELERQAARDKSLIRQLISYIRRLREEIRRLGGEVPVAPPGLEDILSGTLDVGIVGRID